MINIEPRTQIQIMPLVRDAGRKICKVKFCVCISHTILP